MVIKDTALRESAKKAKRNVTGPGLHTGEKNKTRIELFHVELQRGKKTAKK